MEAVPHDALANVRRSAGAKLRSIEKCRGRCWGMRSSLPCDKASIGHWPTGGRPAARARGLSWRSMPGGGRSVRPPGRSARAGLGTLLSCVAWTAACAGGAGPSSQADADVRCVEGTRWEPRVNGCVADAPDDESLEAMCADEPLRPTREIMGEVQDLERRRSALAEDDG